VADAASAAPPALFIVVTGAGVCRDIGGLIGQAVAAGWTTYTLATPNVNLVTPADRLLDIPGSHPIRDYGQPPLDLFPFGTMLVAPCTFNTFNKLAHGIADNLATAMLADALGAGCPIIIAPAMNHGLWKHPQTRASAQRLAAWGCTVIPPQIGAGQVVMASHSAIMAHLHAHFRR
jgi:hypothetical protein